MTVPAIGPRAAISVRRIATARLAMLGLALMAGLACAAGALPVIERVKGAVVAVGTWEPTRSPAFDYRGTGFAVDDGTLIVTNAHVLPGPLDGAKKESLAIAIPAPDGGKMQIREAKQVAVDAGADLALLRIDGAALPALSIGDSDAVMEGQGVFFTGFPLGTVLGLFAATHRGFVAAITPIAIPRGRSAELDPKVIRRLTSGPFAVFQLDATAYPGSSGSPVFDPETGKVIGIINMVLVKGTKESVLTQPSGITYAIPSKHLQTLLQKAPL
ncbi:MAG: serine protease [Betaproteobacteria bacterium]